AIFPGNEIIRDALEQLPPTFVVCGHSHWESAEAQTLKNGTRVLNVDARAHLLVSRRATPR
ncbi:MAG: metallophosphoesterase family protein, partial [Planctomycetaceae bacterium]